MSAPKPKKILTAEQKYDLFIRMLSGLLSQADAEAVADASVAWLDYDGEYAVVSVGAFDPETESSVPGQPLVIGPDGTIVK